MSAIETAATSGQFMPFPMEGSEHCPTCEQPIPGERVAAVMGRAAALERDLRTSIAGQFERLREDDRARSQQALDAAEAQARAREASIRLEADKVLEARLADANRDRDEGERRLKEQVIGLEREQAAKAQAVADKDTELARMREEAQQLEERHRSELATTVDEQVTARVGEMQAQHDNVVAQWQKKSIEDARLHQESERDLKDQLARQELAEARQAQVLLEKTAEIGRIKADALQSEARIRKELTLKFDEQVAERVASLQVTQQQTVDELQRQIADSERREQEAVGVALAEAKQRQLDTETQLARLRSELEDAEIGKGALTEELKAAQETKAAEIAQAVEFVREALERDKVTALQAEESKHFDERQKWKDTVDKLQRQIEKQSTQDLGEGAELKLFDELKARFDGDVIRQVKPGTPGADIVHEVKENGVVCGKIVYDSKNRNNWKTEYATKLRADQLAERADHAVLSSNKFREGVRQLDVVENVIVACPARVLVIAELLRQHVVQMHLLQASTKAREEKSQELYAFITSPRCAQHFATVNSHVTQLEGIDVAELEAHQKVWAKRDKVIKALEKANGDLRFEITRIVGALDGGAEG